MKTWWLAHPLGAGTRRGELVNLQAAEAWLAALSHAEPDAAIIAPWITSLRAQIDDDRDPAARARAMRRNLAVVRRCEGIVLCGPRLSPGMREELREALEHDLEVAWLIGHEPPASATCDLLGSGRRYWRAHLAELARHWRARLDAITEERRALAAEGSEVAA